MCRALSSLILAAIVAPVANAGSPAGPFGLSAGMSRSEIEARTGALQEVGTHVLLAVDLPGGYPELETYTLFVTPEEGLCRIQATSAVIIGDGRGSELRERFNRLLERLWEAHGNPEVVDRLVEGSAWSSEDDWMVALYEGDRALMTLWHEDAGSRLPAGITRIVLSARAIEPGEGFVNLDYSFSGWSSCRARFDAAERARA